MIPHRIEKLVGKAHTDVPGKLLAACRWPEGGTCIILDDDRVRTYYGPSIEGLVDAAHAAALWLREDLTAQEGPGNVTPGAIVDELDAALAGYGTRAAVTVNAVVQRLHGAALEAQELLGALRAISTPSPAMAVAQAALATHPLAVKANVAREVRRVLRLLTVALGPFGEVTRG